MKINILIPVLGPGGGIRVIYEIANRLSEDHDVKLYYPAIHPEAGLKGQRSVREAFKMGYSSYKRAIRSVEWMEVEPEIKTVLGFNKPLRSLLQARIRNADILVATSWPTAYAANYLPESKGEKYYFMQHYEIWPVWNSVCCWKSAEKLNGDPSVAMVDVDPNDDYLSYYKHKVDTSYNLPMNIIRTSKWEGKILDRLGESSVGSIPYGVDHELFSPSIKTDQQTILALYRDSPEKGDREAIQAFKLLDKTLDNVRFMMFGKSHSSNIPDFVEFEQNPSQERIRDIYSMSDVFVYPSWVEGYGMPPMEAMSCSTALVSTDVGAVREYTPETGVEFVPIRDVKAIVSAVENLIKNPERTEAMKEANRDYIQQYTWDETASKFEEILIS